jgi:hypothetical protein
LGKTVIAFIRLQIAEIEKRLTAFQAEVFAAGLKSFEQSENPLRVNNFAMNLRELSRLILHELSPENEIQQCCWYEQEFNDRGDPIITRAQRIRYAVQAGLPEDFVKDKLMIDVGRVIKEHGKIVDSLSNFTHLGKKTFGVDEDRADQLADEALDMFMELLQTIEECREEVHRTLENAASDALNEEMISRTIQELDEISTHHTVEYTHIEHFELVHMGPTKIVFRASGSVDCELQYGSDGDYARGEGLRVDCNFPLTSEFEADIATPLSLEVKKLEVDNSSFYE